MHQTSRSDRVFLLRCWQENGDPEDDERTRWRFLLEEVAPQRGRQGFVALDDLLAFLRREFGDVLSMPEKSDLARSVNPTHPVNKE